jgi:hypothetical protein
MHCIYRRIIVASALLAAASIGCSTTGSASGEGGAATEGAAQTEAPSDESETSEAQEASTDDANQEPAKQDPSAVGELPEGFERPDGCPDVVQISLPEGEKSKKELRSWFCERFEQAGTPSFEDAHSGTFTGACTLEQTQRQEAYRRVTREVSCYGDDGRTLAILSLSDGKIKFVRRHLYNGNDEPVETISGNSENCSIERRQGDTAAFFESTPDGGMRISTKKTFDDEGRIVEEVLYYPDGRKRVTRHEHESGDEKRVETAYRGGQKQVETVEYLRDDGSVARETQSFFSDGEFSYGSEKLFDEQGRQIQTGPLNAESTEKGKMRRFEYRGDSEHPSTMKIVVLENGEEASTVTVAYELNDDGEPLSSTITFPSGDTMSESWSYEDGKLAESHTFQFIDPSGQRMRKEHIEIRYDDQGRPVYHHRWTGEKDGRTYAGHETEMTYECLE